ncbi:tautomerase family protein [Flavobacterium sp. CSZ]|uniref:tautomerase family protein n=1 Tax=Flavobacterium sp. CSZ TaxID=2783791 RepID=UPI00188DA2DC|nr:tautomerase family protein [Flavobacterium sp. CSZ]MBF4485731.1 tautomerase family protein [Flavobacterium sp. CSZ]
MPLVRIDIVEGRTEQELSLLTDTIQQVLIETFDTPVLDRYQIIHEHKPGTIKALDTGLGYERTDKIVVLQITQQGRSTQQKQAMYASMSRNLEKIGIPPTDLIISVVENKKEDWSFGLGRAQFLEGDL